VPVGYSSVFLVALLLDAVVLVDDLALVVDFLVALALA